MTFSFDTNLIIGLIIEFDRLHETSKDLVHSLLEGKGKDLVLTSSSVRETEEKLRKAINKALIKLYPYVLDLIKLSKDDFQTEFLEIIEDLKKEDRYRSSFYEVLYDKTMKYLNEGKEKKKLPNFWSELSIELSRSVEAEIKRNISNYKIIQLEKEDIEDIFYLNKVLAGKKIKFKDQYDGEIFNEIIIYSQNADVTSLEFFFER